MSIHQLENSANAQDSSPNADWNVALNSSTVLQRGRQGDHYRLSPKLVAALLAAIALGISIVGEARHESGDRNFFDLLLYAAAGAIWLVEDRKTGAARWLTIIFCLGLVVSGAVVFWGPLLWMLLFVPVFLSMLLLGIGSALLTAVVESILYLSIRYLDLATAAGTEPLLVLFNVWLPTLLLSLYVGNIQQLIGHWTETLLRARSEVEETRDRKLERETMLAELTLANRNLHLLNERINAMRALAEEAHQAKASFVANISHEFRTPLNMIIGMIDILTRKPEVDGETIPVFLREDLEIVRRNASYLADMVNDVLDMSQSETGQLLLRREWGDLGADLRNAVAVVQPLLDKKQLRLNVVVADDLPRIYYDRARIRQVVLNLVSNAARYTDAGEVSVEVSDESDHLLVSVRDTGLGIPADDLERVFEPFYQAGNVRERSREGSGLGLNICKQIVELHEGRIWVESQEGAGTTVTFRLPSEPPALASTPALRWLDQDWVYVNRTQWPAVPHLPNRQRMVVCDETGVLQQLYGSERPYVELVHVNDLNKVGSLLAQMPAHALLINAYSPQGLLTQVEAAARSLLGSDLPVVGCAFPPLYQPDNLPGVDRILTKPVQYAQLAQVMAGLGRTVRRVLVVDDNVDAGQLFARMVSLISEDIDAQIVHNGADALAQMRTRAPDLVLLDLVMPQMDGRQFLRIKNADQALSHIPVVVVSAEDPASKKPASTVLMASLPRGLAHEAVLQTACKLATLLAQSPAALDREPG